MSNDLFFAGIDDGYAETKICWFGPGMERPGQLKIPSWVREGEVEKSLDGTADVYLTNKQVYTVVRNPQLARDLRKIKPYSASSENRVLIHHALKRAGLGGKRVSVRTGLPIDQFLGSSSGINEKCIAEKTVSVRAPVLSHRGGAPLAEIVDHDVIGEALAAALDSMADWNGLTVAEESGPWAVVDIGGHTTDCIGFIHRGAAMKMNTEQRFTVEWGVLRAEDRVRDALVREYGFDRETAMPLVRGCLGLRKIVAWGDELDIGRHCDEAISTVGTQILDALQERLGDGANLNKIIFVGGGAPLFTNVTGRYRNAKVAEDPGFANARGMLKAAINEASEQNR